MNYQTQYDAHDSIILKTDEAENSIDVFETLDQAKAAMINEIDEEIEVLRQIRIEMKKLTKEDIE